MKAIEFEGISKQYRLGQLSTGTLSHDLNRWWTTHILRKEDPYLKIGEVNVRSRKGTSDYVWALKDINFTVEEGEVVGIIGKNGAGKSTLLKLLSRVTSPTTGVIRARGRVASLLEVGTGFHNEMTGRENIFLNGAILGMSKSEIRKKFDEIVSFSGCERYIDTPVKRYSSGMRVRLGFAIAAYLEPDILVVDEVLAVGDIEFQKKAIGKIQDVSCSEGRTVLFVSHNMSSIRSLCSRGVVLSDGQVSYIGNIDSAIDTYMRTTFDCCQDVIVGKMPRTGKCTGKIRFEGIAFIDRENRPAFACCGKFLRIRMKISVSEFVPDCRLSIDLYSMYGNILMTFPSFQVHDVIPIAAGVYYADLDIDRLPLTIGSYRLSLWSGNDRVTSDYIDRLIVMEVTEDDYFGTGRVVEAHQRGKVVFCDYKWEINDSDEKQSL